MSSGVPPENLPDKPDKSDRGHTPSNIPNTPANPGSPQGLTGSNLWILLIGSFVLMSGASTIFTLVAQLQDEYEFPTYGLGLVTGTYFLGSLIAQLWFSRYADRGFAKVMLVGGITAGGISLLGFGFSTELWQFIMFRFFGGLAEGFWQPGARASIVAGRMEESGKRLGQLMSAILGGVTLGPLFGTLLHSAGGLSFPFWFTGGICLFMVPMILKLKLYQPETQGTVGAPADSKSKEVGILILLKRKESLLALLLAVAVFFPVGVYDALWARFLEDIGASTFFVGVSFVLYGLPFVILATVGGKLSDRFGAVRLAFLSMLIQVPIIAAYGQMTRPGILVIISVIEGTVAAAAFPACQSAMAKACKQNERALGQGLAGGASFAIGGAMAIASAPIYGSLGAGWTFGITAFVVLLITLVAFVLALKSSQLKMLPG